MREAAKHYRKKESNVRGLRRGLSKVFDKIEERSVLP